MNRRISLFVATLVVVAVVGMIPLAAAMTGDATSGSGEVDGEDVHLGEVDDGDGDGESNETGSELTPGERFSGVVGVQQAEFQGNVSERAFAVRLAEAETDEERAAVIDEQLERNEQRLEAIADRQNELQDRRVSGEMSEGAYTARTARTGVEVESVTRTTERSAMAADSLPDHVREERGITGDRIDTIRERASSLSGPEVAEMAREIGGNRTGGPMGPPDGDRPETPIGPPGDDDDTDPDIVEDRPDREAERNDETASNADESDNDDRNTEETDADETDSDADENADDRDTDADDDRNADDRDADDDSGTDADEESDDNENDDGDRTGDDDTTSNDDDVSQDGS